MSRADFCVSLIKAAVSGDVATARDRARQMIAHERSNNRHGLATRFQDALNAGMQARPTSAHNSVNPTEADCVWVEAPVSGLSALHLEPQTRTTCTNLLDEWARREELAAHGLVPRSRLLLTGPPGNGKTSLAQALAFELGLPLLTVRYDELVGSLLGETGARLARVFEQALTQPCMLFFDEFEAVGKERGDSFEMGEMRRAVATLLMQIDRVPPSVLLVAATNHPEMLDRAVWRRFQVQLALPAPDFGQVAIYLHEFFKGRDIDLGKLPRRLAEQLEGLSFSEIEDFCADVLRWCVLRQQHHAGDIINELIAEIKARGGPGGTLMGYPANK